MWALKYLFLSPAVTSETDNGVKEGEGEVEGARERERERTEKLIYA